MTTYHAKVQRVPTPPKLSPKVELTGPASVEAGGSLVYSGTIKNVGHTDARGAVVTVKVPQTCAFDRPHNAGWTFDKGTGIATLHIAHGQPLSFHLALIVKQNAPPGIMTSTFSVNATGTHTENSVRTLVLPDLPDLATSVKGPEILSDGGRYTVTIENKGNANAGASSVTILLPHDTEFIPQLSDPAIRILNGVLTRLAPPLAHGQQYSFNLVLRTRKGGVPHYDSIEVDDATFGPDKNRANNSAVVRVGLLPPA